MKAQIRAKTRNRGRDWAVFRRPDRKKAAGSLVGFVAGDALKDEAELAQPSLVWLKIVSEGLDTLKKVSRA
jgi:hypothetical protein